MTRILAVLLWVAAALAVTAVGAGAVNLVTSQINDPPTAPLSAEALEALPSTPSTPPGTAATSSTVTTRAAVPDSTTSTTSATDQAPTTTEAAAVTTSPPSPSTTTGARYQSFTLGTGTVLIEFVPDGILWHSATPQSGYTLKVEETGPQKVVVKFESTDPNDDRSATFEAEWKDGRLEWEFEEEDDD